MANNVATEAISLLPGEDLTDALYCVVTINSSGQAILPTADTQPIVGYVGMNADLASGSAAIPVTMLKGKVTLKAGGNITAGQLLVAEANSGKVLGVANVAATTADQFIIGVALQGAVEDDVFEAFALPGYTATDA